MQKSVLESIPCSYLSLSMEKTHVANHGSIHGVHIAVNSTVESCNLYTAMKRRGTCEMFDKCGLGGPIKNTTPCCGFLVCDPVDFTKLKTEFF